MIMQTVGIYDQIDLHATQKPGIAMETNLSYLPVNENNLVYQAARLLMDEFQVKQGIYITLRKFIPVAAGMAGGSSDAAAVLFGVNKMFGLGLSRRELMERGVRIGADVPYCILGGTALAEGIGEKLTPLPPIPACRILIAKPDAGVSTKYVYEHLDLTVLNRHPDIDGMTAAIRGGDLAGITGRMENVLETVTIPAHPVIADIKEQMLRLGAENSLMSGSGPTVFGVFRNPESAESAYRALADSGSAIQVFLTAAV